MPCITGCTQRRVAFQPNKSQLLAIAYHYHPPWNVSNLLFGVQTVQTASDLQHLHGTFDEQLSFNSHIRNML